MYRHRSYIARAHPNARPLSVPDDALGLLSLANAMRSLSPTHIIVVGEPAIIESSEVTVVSVSDRFGRVPSSVLFSSP